LGSVCREGHHDCLRRIEPDEVVEAAMTLLTGARPGAEAAMPTPPPPVVLGADQAALGLAAP
jgi:hypothetical protein